MLSKITETPAPQLLVTYGRFIYPKLHAQLKGMGLEFGGSFELFSSLDNIIHPEVLKLYPDAELPNFNATKLNDHQLLLKYSSCRPFAHMAEGLTLGAAEHFDENLSVTLEHHNTDDNFYTDITITRQ